MVDGALTAERIGEQLTISRYNMERLAEDKPPESEMRQYARLEDACANFDETKESRRQIVTDLDDGSYSPSCFTSIQLVGGVLIVSMRSADTARLKHDLGALSRIGLGLRVSRILLTIGSLHTYL